MDSGTHSGPPSRACAVTPSDPTPNIEASWMDSGIWGSVLLVTLSRHCPLRYMEHSSFMLERHNLPPPCPRDACGHSVTGKGWSTGSAGLVSPGNPHLKTRPFSARMTEDMHTWHRIEYKVTRSYRKEMCLVFNKMRVIITGIH